VNERDPAPDGFVVGEEAGLGVVGAVEEHIGVLEANLPQSRLGPDDARLASHALAATSAFRAAETPSP